MPQYKLEILVEGQDRASGVLERVAGGLGGLGSAALGLALPVGAAVAGLGGLGIALNASAEQTEMAFTTLLGSGEAATAFLDDLRAFSAETPFEFPELADSSRKLLAFGFAAEEIIPMMTSIGDAVGALGGGQAEIDRVTMALGQMQAKGKVSAEEMMQLAELGIPAWDMLATSMGITTAEAMDLASKGLIPADQAIQSLLGGMDATFGGAMQGQATTFNGLLSTLKDNASMALQAFTGPLFEAAKGGLSQLGALVSSPAFQQFAAILGEQIGAGLAALMTWLAPVGEQLMAMVAGLFQGGEAGGTFGAILDAVWPILERVGGWVVAIAGWFQERMLPALQEVGSGFLTMLQPHIQWLADFAQTRLMPALEAVGQFIGDNLPGFIAVAGPLITGFVDLNLSILRLAFEGIAAAWTNLLQPAFSALSGWIGRLTGGWDTLVKGAQRLRDMIGDVAEAIRGLAGGKLPGWLSGLLGGGGGGKPPASLPGFAGGVTNFSGGLALVGERGPELLNLPRGSNVYSAGETRSLLGGNGGGITINMGGVTIDSEERLRQFGEELERRVRAAVGGDLSQAVDRFILAGGSAR